MTGNEKKSTALADVTRERQARLQRESAERIRRFRDSIDLEDSDPTLIINMPPVSPPPSKRSLAPQGPKGWALAIAGVLAALAALAKAVAEVLQ